MTLNKNLVASLSKFNDTAHNKSTPSASSLTFQVQRARNEPSGLYTMVLRSSRSDSRTQYKMTLDPNIIEEAAAKARAVGTALVIAASSATATRTAGFTLGFPSAPVLEAYLHVVVPSTLFHLTPATFLLSFLHRIPLPRNVTHAVRMEPIRVGRRLIPLGNFHEVPPLSHGWMHLNMVTNTQIQGANPNEAADCEDQWKKMNVLT